jgi:deoxyadenosine/deoxycytidine kinase
MASYKIVSIEGNIGSGKSTLLHNFREYVSDKKEKESGIEYIFLREPVDEWESIKDKEGNTILQKFYADQKKYSFSFQMMAYLSRLALLKDTVDDINKRKQSSGITYFIITERCLYTDRHVFAKMLYDNGNIEEIDYQIYLKWFDAFIRDYEINKIVYVNASPEMCHKRILERSRLGEDNIPLEYLSSCHDYHENMINCEMKDSIILELDGNIDIKRNPDHVLIWCENVEDFILDIV